MASLLPFLSISIPAAHSAFTLEQFLFLENFLLPPAKMIINITGSPVATMIGIIVNQ